MMHEVHLVSEDVSEDEEGLDTNFRGSVVAVEVRVEHPPVVDTNGE